MLRKSLLTLAGMAAAAAGWTAAYAEISADQIARLDNELQVAKCETHRFTDFLVANRQTSGE